MVYQRSSMDLMSNCSWSLHDRLDNWGMGHSKSWSSNSVNKWGRGSNSSDDWGSNSWGSNKWSSHNGGWDSLGNGVNKTILVDVLRESLKRNRSQTSVCGDKISKSSGERSSNWSLNNRLKELGVSFSFVDTVNGLKTCSWKFTSVTRCICRSIEIWVCVGGVRGVQRIGFRLSQAERGYGENYDHALHFCLTA